MSGSPAQAMRRRRERSYFAGASGPWLIHILTAVGAVKRRFTPKRSQSSQVTSGVGQSGTPSRQKTVAPTESGP